MKTKGVDTPNQSSMRARSVVKGAAVEEPSAAIKEFILMEIKMFLLKLHCHKLLVVVAEMERKILLKKVD